MTRTAVSIAEVEQILADWDKARDSLLESWEFMLGLTGEDRRPWPWLVVAILAALAILAAILLRKPVKTAVTSRPLTCDDALYMTQGNLMKRP